MTWRTPTLRRVSPASAAGVDPREFRISPCALHGASTLPCHDRCMNDGRFVSWQVSPGELKPFALAARLRSFIHALRGVRAVLASQHNAWLHAAATGSVVVAGLVLGVSRFEWMALLFAVVSVWTAEVLNTAFEALCDVASPQFHPLVARAKDVAAGAVLICAAGAVVTAGLVFGPHLTQLW